MKVIQRQQQLCHCVSLTDKFLPIVSAINLFMLFIVYSMTQLILLRIVWTLASDLIEVK